MSRLLVQHPELQAGTVEALGRELGASPSAVASGRASWTLNDGGRTLAERIAQQYQLDAAWIDEERRLGDFRLMAFDMDSTLITIECIDEMADFFGKKAEVAAITAAAMRGEIADYNESLLRRTAFLVGLDETQMLRIYEERLALTPGVEKLVQDAKRAGLKILLVSGGFTFFADRVARRLDIDFVRANALEMADARMTGRLVGEIVNADVKKRTVEEVCARLGCSTSQAIVVGDGANDLKMMGIAGRSIAYRAKPVVRQQASFAINYCGLDAALNFFA